ncbi:MAG: hypothetical protein COV59_02575 [Candidatus Magasanikbacteria bacterium CG11_big_fil_rev_8_21_14_0_20_39_34]|uniref:Phosphoenolpyruvate synthase n=1 Tax=Candidatus Magasanikbacteria bacterium CG11_big_fil_rev_8_21_14_0_20_39_34 TaxID=1974653 RepID=A0A2H0N573_9BACT|nr:MAG: hypothetical protein COV59_02575 [Candidatus Magasanikbacteria bacterium CG11_big_fil_rev_8_21_14_0_20_39_34]
MYIEFLDNISQTDLEKAGGKGASLAEMKRSGIPVPNGFILLTSAFELFVQKSGISSDIEKTISGLDYKKLDEIEVASQKIQAMIMQQNFPTILEEELQKAFHSLNAQFVAVRSSATAEDGAYSAWAGQLDTFLNTKEENLIQNVKQCWASLFSTRALFYRFEKGFHNTNISVGVVVQKMIQSEVSGVAFSVHPVIQKRNLIYIEAGYGLGEAVVSGAITPDSYVVEKSDFQIVEKTISVQEQKLVLLGEKNEWVSVDKDRREKPKLTEEHIGELSRLVVKIEKQYGFPCDIEWSLFAEKLYIMQSRPITTLNHEEKMNLPNWKNEEVFRWGPIRGYYFYISDFVTACYQRFPQTYKEYWPEGFLIFNNEQMVWISDMDEFVSRGKHVFETYVEDNQALRTMKDDWGSSLSDLILIQEKIEKMDLATLNDEQFKQVWKEFYDSIMKFWLPTLISELGNYGAPSLLKEDISKILDSQEGIIKVQETLTAPEELSFYQQEELDLVSSENINAHQQKYFWLKNSYGFSDVMDSSFFHERKQKLLHEPPGLDSKQLKKKVQEAKKSVQEEFTLPEAIIRRAQLISENLVWQDQRKRYICENFYYKKKLLLDLSRRLNKPLDDLLNFHFEECFDMLEGREAPSRFEYHGVHFKEDIKSLSREEAKACWDKYAFHKVSDVESFSGVVASKGTEAVVRGKVRVLNSSHSQLEDGEVLVTSMTSPGYVFAMRHAVAVVTDIGGLNSHAAIVSREIGVPCIVGTKVATQVLKTGDMVEVDTDLGTVKIL